MVILQMGISGYNNKKRPALLRTLKLVESIGVEPTTFPLSSGTLLTSQLFHPKKKARITANLIKLVESIGVEPTTFPLSSGTLLTTLLIHFKKNKRPALLRTL